MVSGSRDAMWEKHSLVITGALRKHTKDVALEDLLVIHGNARGVDSIISRLCQINEVAQTPYPADWKAYGKRAGPKRNQQMLDEGKPDVVLCFPYMHKASKGTHDVRRRAKEAGIELHTIWLS